MKIAVAQINPVIGDFEHNFNRIMHFSEKDPDRLIQLLLDIAFEHFDQEYVGIYSWENQTLKLIDERGDRHSIMPNEFVDQVIDSDRPVRLKIEPAMNNGAGENKLDAIISSSSKLGTGQGILFIGRETPSRPFNDADMEMFALLSRQGVVALENAYLYSELQEKVQQIEKGNRISRGNGPVIVRFFPGY